MSKIRHADKNCILLPDSKSQITLEYAEGKPHKATSVVVSTQHIKVVQEDIKNLSGYRH